MKGGPAEPDRPRSDETTPLGPRSQKHQGPAAISSSNGDWYCLNCLYSFRAKNKLESHKNACQNKDFCNVVVPSEDTKILEFNQYRKSDKAPFTIYADLESLIVKIGGCKNNPGKSSMRKVCEHFPSGFSMSTISSFKDRK